MTLRIKHVLFASLLCALASCGGGENGAVVTSNPLVVSGIAATGATMANAVVSVKCAVGATVSGVTAADGSFALTLRGGQAWPCLVKVKRGEPELTLYSLATGAKRVNVTPLADLALARALGASGLGSDAVAAFPLFNAAAGGVLQTALPAAKIYVNAQVQAVTGLALATDIFTGAFQIGDADDKVLDALGSAMALAGLEIADLRQIARNGGDLKAALEVHPTEPLASPVVDPPDKEVVVQQGVEKPAQ